MSAKRETTEVPFEEIINALLDNVKPFPPKYLHRFSDLNPKDLAQLKTVWNKIATLRRSNLLTELEEIQNVETLVCFDDLAVFALDDNEASCRTAATRILSISEDYRLIKKFIDMMKNDPEVDVRAAAATALGQFVFLGEMEEIPDTKKTLVEEVLLATVQGNDKTLVRRRALEAIGYSYREEIPSLIQKAFDSGKKDWQASALFAMGRSANPHWEKIILKMLRSPIPELQFEAVRAAGELDLKNAREPLLEMLQNAELEEDDTRLAAIWSLSQLGGAEIAEFLEAMMEKSEDDEEIEFISEALDNLEFNNEIAELDLLNIEEQDIDDLINIMDISKESDDKESDQKKTRKKKKH
jgi:HEAT repeat protein